MDGCKAEEGLARCIGFSQTVLVGAVDVGLDPFPVVPVFLDVPLRDKTPFSMVGIPEDRVDTRDVVVALFFEVDSDKICTPVQVLVVYLGGVGDERVDDGIAPGQFDGVFGNRV